MIFSSNLGLVFLEHSLLLLQVLIASNALPDFLASTWVLWWHLLLVSPPSFSPHVALHGDQVTILSWCVSVFLQQGVMKCFFFLEASDYYFDGGWAPFTWAHFLLLLSSSSPRYFTPSHGWSRKFTVCCWVAATGLGYSILEGHGYSSLVPCGETVAIVLCTLVYLNM